MSFEHHIRQNRQQDRQRTHGKEVHLTIKSQKCILIYNIVLKGNTAIQPKPVPVRKLLTRTF